MKNLILFLFVFVLLSCEKDENKIAILNAKVNNEYTEFIGKAYRYTDLRDDVSFGYNYHIFNLETPIIYIEIYDSTFVRNEFDFVDLKATYACFDSLGNSNSYDAIDGEFSFDKEEKKVIYGSFSFTLINIRDDSDTLIIKDGSFELSLIEQDRVWY
ncbi:MAG: hypothetical protein PF486_08650 [Prolixibacteraceae bacterium]|jgi:hypothetical protein|nr:hypothetical protein [Prolixibacteraceae bacterium]